MPSEPFQHCHDEKEEVRSEPLALPLTNDVCGEDAKLLSFGDIPEWYQDNQYIQAGYRPVSGSAKACFRSWFRLHNELVNIHSHLVAALAFLLAEAYILEPLHRRYAQATPGDYVVLAFFLFTATVCFGLSAAYHTLICHSQSFEAIWLRLDLVGIILLILGSFVTGIYVGFWCENLERNIYWGMIVGLSALSIVVMLHPKFQGPRWRTFRLMTFVCTGLSGIAPIAHGIHMFGFDQMLKQSGLPYYLAEAGLFLLGAVVYAVSPPDYSVSKHLLTSRKTRFPERIKPGAFDIWGSSHQIFHVLVVFATVVHLVGVRTAFDYNYWNRQCASH